MLESLPPCFTLTSLTATWRLKLRHPAERQLAFLQLIQKHNKYGGFKILLSILCPSRHKVAPRNYQLQKYPKMAKFSQKCAHIIWFKNWGFNGLPKCLCLKCFLEFGGFRVFSKVNKCIFYSWFVFVFWGWRFLFLFFGFLFGFWKV